MGGLTACKSPLDLDGQDVGPSGVATGRGAFNLSSSSSVGMKKAPTDGSFTLSNCIFNRESGIKRKPLEYRESGRDTYEEKTESIREMDWKYTRYFGHYGDSVCPLRKLLY
ncbi:hypothetical protein [Rummeliibacillus sp. SL167]|uniref:hypothetical protein n=1 Tax=Rummeliibacillus sp. SL167 TaxID=2579792 RepID=UPI0016479580|nr:hypothetical protein [Rummeliibacillus sp. SL167]